MRALTVFVVSTCLVLSWSSTSYAACAPKGVGNAPASQPDKQALNRLKNRTVLPSGVETMTVEDILALAGHDDKQPHPEDAQLEAKGVVVTGWLLGQKHEGPESPNCGSSTRRDYHMWLGGTKPPPVAKDRMAMRDQAVVVEPTPNMQDRNQTWIQENITKLVGKHIRIMGWLMFDWEHPEQLGNTRGTLWEVHPVMRIEVEQPNGTWKKL
jgi:hypothetical protein